MVLSVLSFLWSLSFIHSVAKWRSTKNWSHSPKRFSLILNFPFNFIRPKSDCRNGILITYSHCLPDFNRVLRDSWNETFYDSQIYLHTHRPKEGEKESHIPQLWTSLIGFFIVSISLRLESTFIILHSPSERAALGDSMVHLPRTRAIFDWNSSVQAKQEGEKWCAAVRDLSRPRSEFWN